MAHFTICWNIRHGDNVNFELLKRVELDFIPVPGMKIRTGTAPSEVTITEVIIDPDSVEHFVVVDTMCSTEQLANGMSRGARDAGWD